MSRGFVLLGIADGAERMLGLERNPPQRIAWTGVTMGIRAVDVFRLEAAEGGTLVREDESWEGLPVRLFRGPLRRTLAGGIRAGLQALKAETERRAYTERAERAA